jgi:VanZ family protein
MRIQWALRSKMRISLAVKNWIPVVFWVAVMFVGSTDLLSADHTSRFLIPFLRWLDPTISFRTIQTIHSALRRIAHLAEYAILATLLWRALRGTFSRMSRFAVSSITFLVAASFAASDEYHQSFMPSRTGSVHDVAIDCLGALAAVLVCVMISRARGAKVGSASSRS